MQDSFSKRNSDMQIRGHFAGFSLPIFLRSNIPLRPCRYEGSGIFLNLSLLHEVDRFMPSYHMHDSVDRHQNGQKKAILKLKPKPQ
jgi:hypothetical protein